MKIEPTPSTPSRHTARRQTQASGELEKFRQLLRGEMARHDQNAAAANETLSPSEHLLVGTISNTTPTVSEMLLAHPEIGRQGWEILSLAVNRDKPFSVMPDGAQVYLDRQNGELLWRPLASDQPAAWPAAFSPEADPQAATPADAVQDKAHEPIAIGVISQQTPTVSHLLTDHPEFRQNAWPILDLPVNREKAFNRIPTGATVTVSPDTGEISWIPPDEDNKPVAAASVAANARPPIATEQTEVTAASQPAPTETPSGSFTSRLAAAVRPYFGRAYKEIDCYGLLIRGLVGMGIPYEGEQGLRGKLVRMASEQGLPDNAFFTGEGVVQAAGSLVYHKKIDGIRNPDQEAEKVLAEIMPRLEEGAILSFSMPKKGHTGVISSRDDTWTFINSGNLDNSAAPGTRRGKGVGEEILAKEIRNWLRLAGKSQQPLMISLGRLEEEKLRTAMAAQPNRLAAVL